MLGQIGHLSSLIDDLFELAQIDAGALRLELQRASLGDQVSDAIEGMRPQAAAKGVRLEGSVAPGIGPALIAPQKIERVLYNLVTNAVRHTPAGGSVTITVKPGNWGLGTRELATGDRETASSLLPTPNPQSPIPNITVEVS